MARPQKQGMDYFPHDTDASNDEKIDALRMLHGNDGYAFYFILLERIYRTADFELDISDAETIQILARKVEVTPEKFAEMLQTALKRGCFCSKSYEKRRVLTSPGIKKRSSGVVSKRQKMATTYQNRVSAAETPPETPPETPVSDELPSREKKSKEKKIDTNVSKATTPVSDGEVDTSVKKNGNGQMIKPDLACLTAYVLSRDGGTKTMAEEMFDFYTSKGWKVGSSPMADWNAAARKWVATNTTSNQASIPRPKTMVV